MGVCFVVVTLLDRKVLAAERCCSRGQEIFACIITRDMTSRRTMVEAFVDPTDAKMQCEKDGLQICVEVL